MQSGVRSSVKSNPMDLAIRLLQWRKHRLLTLREVSQRSRVHMSTYAMAERGERDLHTLRLAAVVERAFGVTMSRFWGPVPKARAKGARAA